ncbi:MAG: hypothetical protein K7J46_13645 [Bryobacter sp.]|jgi:hypothetical protein|nr:hypothetical protein [Bryobacter sp. CoA8 C33]
MPRAKTSPSTPRLQDLQKELNRLHRRRLALINLIRSVEEYLLVAETPESRVEEIPKKLNVRVVSSRTLKELLA